MRNQQLNDASLAVQQRDVWSDTLELCLTESRACPSNHRQIR